MSQSLANVILHIVFSTKYRTPWLKDVAVREELYAYLATCLKTLDSPAIKINGTSDHVHILCNLSRNHAIKTIVGDIKADSSGWIKTQGPSYRDFYWQAGYGAFSVSQSNVEQVKQYIENQELHHRQMSFQDEFRQICERHGVHIDERYVWE